jgi:hypothetical protein
LSCIRNAIADLSSPSPPDGEGAGGEVSRDAT